MVLDALRITTPATGSAIEAFADRASIAAPEAGYTFTEFAPLLTITILRPVVAVGSVTPLGLLEAVVMTL